jgi:hypothetical protein
MASDSEVNIKFGATIDDLKSKLGEIGGLFTGLIGQFAALAAVAAGGAIFKSFIDATNALNGEQMKLSKTLGITGEDAATLNTALGDIGSDADTYTGAFLKFNRQLKNNSDGMKELGVDVDGFTSGQKTSNEVFQEAIRIVQQYKPGIDQTQVAMQLFGRSVEDVQKLMKLTPALFEEARKKNEELNLSFSADSVAASKAYKLAMADVGDVMQGLKNTVGQGVIPIFTDAAKALASTGPALVDGLKTVVEVGVDIFHTLAETVQSVWSVVSQVLSAFGGVVDEVFGKDAPSAMEIFKDVLRTIDALFIGFRISFQLVVDAVQTGLAWLSNGFTSFASVAERALHLDFAGAQAEWAAGVDRGNAILQAGMNKAVQIAERGQADINRAVMTTAERKAEADQNYGHEGSRTGTPAPKKTVNHFGKPDKETTDKTAGARLALAKAENEADLALERENLKEAQSIYDEAFKNNLISIQQFYAAKLAIETEALEATLATKRKELADAQTAAGGAQKEEAKLKFMAQAAKLQGEINVLTAQEAAAVQKNTDARKDAEQKLADELSIMRAGASKAQTDDVISTEKKNFDVKRQMGLASAEEAVDIDKAFEQRSYDALLLTLQAKRDAVHGDNEIAAKEREAIDNEELAAERAHQQKLGDIDRAAVLERGKYSIEAQNSIGGGFTTMVEGMAHGVTKMSDLFKNFAKTIADTFIHLAAQKLTDKLFDVLGVKKLLDKMVSFVTEGISNMVGRWVAGKATEEAVTVGTEAAKTSAVVAGTAIRTTAETGAAAESTAVTGSTAIANIGAKAWEAAASVYASIAAIPYVGPFLAPAMAIAAGAAVLGFASRIMSSEGGDDRTVEGLRYVHKDETILSQPYAQGLRSLVGQGGLNPILDVANKVDNAWRAPPSSLGRIQNPQAAATSAPAAGGGGRGSGGDVHLHVQAVDAASVKKLFMEHGGALADSLRKQGRNFSPKS